jgi:hypothetical protein
VRDPRPPTLEAGSGVEIRTDGNGQAVFDVPFTPPADKPIITATATISPDPAVIAVAAALPVRRGRLRLLGAATAAMVVGAWIGGDLVFRHGWRVRPAEEAEIVEQLLRDPAAADAFATARREVADFERQKTFLPPG